MVVSPSRDNHNKSGHCETIGGVSHQPRPHPQLCTGTPPRGRPPAARGLCGGVLGRVWRWRGPRRSTAPRSRPSAGKQLKSTGPRPGPRSCVSTLVDGHLYRLLAPCGTIAFAATVRSAELTQDGAQLGTEMFPGLKLSQCRYAICRI